ncbi:uncharacterized protein LOC110712140 isoform X2 [Chenopodium quinoa]|uniref:uncharacterized protein LOC110712140 isoform X2 n=1 Tax=Chenopodium quinoa TaxID=63459 RepID=UPI000B78742F|nr:uncharacterized protein LOC110712140 isoform X2 [Chenopodium quinoa]
MLTVGEVDSEGHLELWEDPEAWIKNNPASRLALVTSLDLNFYLRDDVEEIGEFIGEFTQLICLKFVLGKSLKSLPMSIANLSNLTFLALSHCNSLVELPANIGQLVSLTHLELQFCKNIKSLPMSIANLSNLTFLSLFFCDSLVELPANIGQLVSLTHLKLFYCNSIKSLPMSIANLSKLTSLSLCACYFLVELPANIGQLVSLTHLELSCSGNIKSLPMSIANLSNLIFLNLSHCNSLVELPENIGQLVSLTHLELGFCKNIKSLPMSIANLSNLTSLNLESCDFLTELPSNLGQMKSLSHLELHDCNNIKSLPDSMKDLCSLDTLFIEECYSLTQLPIKLKYLRVTVCSCSDESLANWKDPCSLQHLSISGCERHGDYIIIFALLNQFVNLQVLSLHDHIEFVEWPANLDGLAQLCLLEIQQSDIKCLPWSITKLRKLQHLMLPEDFRLETLPFELNNSVIISVKKRHVRKSWEELKTEIGELPNPFGGEIGNDDPSFMSPPGYLRLEDDDDDDDDAAQNPSIMSPPGYLRLEEDDDPSQWIINNRNLLMLVRFLDLEIFEELTDSIMQFSELTHLYLYINDHICLPDNYFVTFTRLTHLSLHFSKFGIAESVIHSLSKLSNLQTLHLRSLKSELPENFNMPVSLKHLSLSHCNMRPLYDSLEKLTNLRSLDLNSCYCCESLPPCMYIHKLRLVDCCFNSLDSLPIGLHHLEILFFKYDLSCIFEKCWNKLVKLETLSITCSEMEFFPEDIARLHNLQKLQLKDCISLRKLPSNLHELVNLHTLDISVTRIKILPSSFVKLRNLQHLILPKCFNFESLPRSLKQVLNIDDTEEAYYKSNDYDASLYQASASDESKDEVTKPIVVPGESCNEDDCLVPTVEIHETVPDEQTSADLFNSISIGSIEHSTTEQGGISQIYKEYNSPKEMADNINVVHPWLNYHCRMQFPPRDLMKVEHLKISLCKCSKELLANLKESMNLLHLAIKDCSQHHVKRFPTNFNELANLKTLSIRCIHIESLPSFAGLCSLLKLHIGGVSPSAPCLEKLPANLDNLDKLLVVDIRDTKIKCLPWSIKNLQKLRFLNLPLDFRLETLSCQLIESVVITVDCMHIRKTWKELKTEMGLLSFRGVGVDEVHNFSTISSSGYLPLKEDPGLWIMKNYDLCVSVRSLELELPVYLPKIGDSIGELPKLTYLYISGNINLDLKHLSGVSKTLRHLSLQHCNIEFLSTSLRKLSNLEFLCLDLGDTNLPSNLDLLVNLKHLSLRHGSKHSNINSLARLSNLKALDLFQCDFESLPANLKLAELKLSGSIIKSLPTSLHRLEILHDKGRCERTKCDVASLNLKQLINIEKLSVTCYSIKLLPSIERLQNLQELQLKDCSSLEALPNDLGKLVKLCTLDISGTRIKSLPDSITKLSNLEHLILPKCFQQDSSLKYPNKGFINVTIDDIVELYFNDMSYDDDGYETSMETSNEGNGTDLDSIEGHNEAISKELEEGSINVQTSPHKVHVIPILEDFCSSRSETPNPEGESIPAIRNDQNDITTMLIEQDNGENSHHDLENGQKQVPQHNMVERNKRTEISAEKLQQCWSENPMSLQETAEKIFGDLSYNKGETSNPSGESSHAIQNTITTATEQGIALVYVTKEIDCGEINHHALESEQNRIPQSNYVVKMKENNITLEKLQSFWSNHTKLEDAAEQLRVSRSTLKRRIKKLGVKWPRKGKKLQPDAKKRKHNNKAPFESDCSQQNLVNLGSLAAHAENVECIMGSDLHTLPNHVSSNSNVVIRGNLMETIDSHQGAEVHLNGANERTLSDALPQNEKSSNFIVKAYYNDDIVRFDFSLSKSIDQLKEEIANKLELEVNTFKIKYKDEEKEKVTVTDISDLEHALNLSRSSNNSSVVRLFIFPKT